jgi:hypothetical protein
MTIEAGRLLVEEIVPRIAAVVARSVKLVGCEDVEEVVQDATAMAAKMLDNAEKAGKKVTVGNIAYYTLQHIKSGRRSVGNSAVDVLATGTQLHGKCQVESVDVLIPADGEDCDGIPLREILSRDVEDPATVAAREVDWGRFLDGQNDCSRNIVRFTAEGRTLKDVSRECGFSSETVKQSRNRLASQIREFFGENILADVAQVPGWKNNLMATRERHAAAH